MGYGIAEDLLWKGEAGNAFCCSASCYFLSPSKSAGVFAQDEEDDDDDDDDEDED